MSTDGVDNSRRRFLTVAATVVGGVGAAFVAVPFVASMQPSARAKAAGAPVEADISKIEPGQMIRVKWRGKPVWILRRTPEMLAGMKAIESSLRDPASNESIQPEYTKNEFRAIKTEYLVAIGICTHLGCSPTYRPEVASADLGPEWKGGFFCPCHGSRFDLAGRVYSGVPAPTNLVIPAHYYMGDSRILIGQDKGVA
ncbi:MAG: ubiquinol-cytochrome c reductase iron-sulfur subunit [Gammaproteobacteria bacterium]|nr:ubiquinol-cytochrome c reductase iron-sulfur subunit [Gammaproteobacteria bacterium]